MLTVLTPEEDAPPPTTATTKWTLFDELAYAEAGDPQTDWDFEDIRELKRMLLINTCTSTSSSTDSSDSFCEIKNDDYSVGYFDYDKYYDDHCCSGTSVSAAENAEVNKQSEKIKNRVERRRLWPNDHEDSPEGSVASNAG